MIFIIDDDNDFANVEKKIVLASGESEVRCFRNVIDAINATTEIVPDLIFLDILLDGPDGFTLLNELQSYEDLARVPVVIVSSIDFSGKNLKGYNVVGVLNKSKMMPKDIQKYIELCRTK